MNKKSLFSILVLIVIFLSVYYGNDFYKNHYVSERILENIYERDNYRITKSQESFEIKFFIKPEWIPFETNDKKELNIKLVESNNTSIILQDIWNRGNDIYFSFHSTYKLKYKNGKLLSNVVLNDDGSFSSTDTYGKLQLFNINQNTINIGQTGTGPGSDFSFGIEPSDYEKIKDGFYINYSGMNLYNYSRK